MVLNHATSIPASVTTPEGTLNYQFNDYGQVTRIKTNADYDVEYAYNELGNLKLVRSRNLSNDGSIKTVRYEYDFNTGRQTKTIFPNGVEKILSYDVRGNVACITPQSATSELLKLT